MNRRPVFIIGAVVSVGILTAACLIVGGWRCAVGAVAAGVIGLAFGWRAR